MREYLVWWLWLAILAGCLVALAIVWLWRQVVAACALVNGMLHLAEEEDWL